MLEPFIWMFRIDNFNKYILKLLGIYIAFYLVSIILFVLTFFIKNNTAMMLLLILSLLFQCLGSFLQAGYFWLLTENVITREWDISLANIYNNKINKRFNIKLPELNVFKFIWRGFASVIATIMMILPYMLLYLAVIRAYSVERLSQETLIIMYIFLCSFIPALLWNYAYTDSIFGVWNLRKAIYLIGNYTFKYIVNILIYVLFGTVCFLVILFLTLMLTKGVSNEYVYIIVFMLIATIVNFYSLHVYAYLLGTIAPVHEEY